MGGKPVPGEQCDFGICQGGRLVYDGKFWITRQAKEDLCKLAQELRDVRTANEELQEQQQINKKLQCKHCRGLGSYNVYKNPLIWDPRMGKETNKWNINYNKIMHPENYRPRMCKNCEKAAPDFDTKSKLSKGGLVYQNYGCTNKKCKATGSKTK